MSMLYATLLSSIQAVAHRNLGENYNNGADALLQRCYAESRRCVRPLNKPPRLVGRTHVEVADMWQTWTLETL